MAKNKAKDGIVVNAGNGNYIPNIVRGGAAIPIGKKNFYYMQGRKHEQGGIDVGRNAKTGLEVEGEEVMQVTPNEVRVYSSVPFLRGVSPAELVLNGADANKVFAAQEKYKDNNRINDDGTKYRTGGNIYKQNVKTVVADNTNINKPIIFDTVERVVSSSDKLNVPIGTKYSELSSKQKIQLLSSDKLNKDKKGLKIVSPEFDILTGIRGLTNLPKGFINNSATKNISTNYYRQGSKGLIDDAKKTGVVSVKSDAAPISSNDKKVSILRKTFNVPFWSKGVKWYDDKASNAKDMIVSIGDNNLDWQMINQHGTFVNDIKKAASRRTPIYNGTVNNTPSNLFEYYRRYPIIGYRNITNGEPTIPITGLDAIANNLNDKNKKQYGGSKTNNMRKLVSINGNVKNGLIHTPNQDVLAYNKERKPRFNGRYSKPGLHNLELLVADLLLPKGKVNIEPDVPKRLDWVEAHNRLVGADISQKPLDAKKDNTNVVHTISETERRTRKFVCGGRSKAKVGKGFRINNDKYNIGDTITYKDKQYIVTDRNEAKPIDKNVNSYVDGITGAARRVPTSPQLTRNITNGLVNNAPTYKKNGETHYFVEAPKVDYDSGTSLADLQNLLNLTPRKGSNQSSSSSTGGVNNRTSKSAKPTIQRVNKLAPATNAEMAGIRRGLEPLLQNTIVDKLNKSVDNDLNVMPVQDDVAKTRNMDNILLGVNLGSSVLDAVMGNIYANQMHGYTAPNITAPTIKNPGEIKLNEEDLKDIPAPILMAAAKLKTRYNANPQLSKIEDDTRRIMGEIGRNTSNSRVALARKQRAALQGQQAKNEVYGRKENIETELINKDKLNQQEVTARNLSRYDQYNQALAAQRANRARLKLAADTANIQNKLAVNTANANLKSQADRFNATNRINQLIHQAGIDAAKAEARSSIFSGMLGNIGSALNTWNRNKRQAKLDEETLRVLGLRAPNANKLVLSVLGY
ncbi:hypothetical protein KNV34_gp63 [uncultured phage cr11_1]|uniref:Uncharacterized protein n=1 Tax=uncultured phage cr11_1 TaxID=2772067 RepID=A0A7M1RWS8_9CAUD|nr:hypothetical protein KNV34_gp63 [uncultured phage cr11_1]QOR58808.1 hypothetical protein [uncultured phage cr11_1]